MCVCVQVSKTNEEENEVMRSALNYEIRKGNTYPQEEELSPSQFQSYFISHYAFIAKAESGEIYGFFYIKPNFPGRSSHICNGGFVVVPPHQGKGVGRLLGQAYLYLARDLGFRGSFFNLVYESNVPSLRLWTGLGFTKAGRIPQAGRLLLPNGEEEYIDAIQIYYDLTTVGPTPF
jgi:GNAT superfamily N-acetyltransferase